MNPAPSRLEHVGIAVADASRTATMLEKVLDLPVYKVEEVLSERVRTYFLHAGAAKLELLEATAPDSPIAKYLEKNREGLHHLAFEVPDIEAAWTRAKEAGLEMLGDGPKAGADGKRIFFLHPRSTGGTLIEFCAQQPGALVPRMIDAGGRLVATYAAGLPNAPALLVLPGAGEAVPWALLLELAPAWRVVAVDGMHPVDKLPTAPELEEQAQVVLHIMDAYKWPAAALLGFGLGASVALHLAAMAPSRVTAVVAHAPRDLPAPTRPLTAPVLISGFDADPDFTPADAVRRLGRYPDARLSISPDRAWGARHSAMRWLGEYAKHGR